MQAFLPPSLVFEWVLFLEWIGNWRVKKMQRFVIKLDYISIVTHLISLLTWWIIYDLFSDYICTNNDSQKKYFLYFYNLSLSRDILFFINKYRGHSYGKIN